MSIIRHLPDAPTAVQQRAAGERISRHRHDEHQLVYVSTGVLAVTTPAGRWVASADRAVWLPAGTWHEHRFYGASAFHTVGFAAGRPPLPARAPAVVAVTPLLRELLVVITEGALPEPEEPIMLPTARDPRLAAACALAAADLSVPVALVDLARAVNAGERTLSRLFRGEFGMTYPQWRTRLRVFESMILLAGGTSVTEAGLRCGWGTTSGFVETFHRTMGRTPGAYRTQNDETAPEHGF